MPLTLAEEGVLYLIQRVCGNERRRNHMEAMGFVEGTTIRILSRFSEYFIVIVKGSKVGLDKEMAKHIIVSAEERGACRVKEK